MNHRAVAQTSLLIGAALLMRGRMQQQPQRAMAQPLAPAMKLELAVKMTCESCSNQVKRAILENNKGVTGVEVDLANELVVVNGMFTTSEILNSLNSVGRDARVVGTGALQQEKISVPESVGSANDGLVAAVAEFKGPIYNHGQVFGVVRLVQVEAEKCAVEVEIDGLEKNAQYSMRVHQFGDTRSPVLQHVGKPLFSMQNVRKTDAKGKLTHGEVLQGIFIWELIGRSLVLENATAGAVGTVIARSAGVGDNSKKRLCTCDGTVIWESKF